MKKQSLSRHQIYYCKNRERIIENARIRREQNPAAHNARCLLSKKKNWNVYLAKNRETNRKLRAKLKAQAIFSLGGRCIRCGYDADIRALQIDHINSNGAIERKASNNNQWSFYKSIIEKGHQEKYQILCANCNQIKRMEMNEHPRGRVRRIQ